MEQTFREFMSENNHEGYSLEDAKTVAELVFLYERKRMETDEPYAVNSIASIGVALEILSNIGDTD